MKIEPFSRKCKFVFPFTYFTLKKASLKTFRTSLVYNIYLYFVYNIFMRRNLIFLENKLDFSYMRSSTGFIHLYFNLFQIQFIPNLIYSKFNLFQIKFID